MSFPVVIHLLKIWEPTSGKILRRLIFKDQAVIGSDRKVDLILKELEGFAARVQFSDRRVEFLNEGREIQLEPHQIFTIGPYAILWTSVTWKALEKWKWPIMGCTGLLLGIFVFGAIWGRSPSCNLLETRLAKSQWASRGLSEQEAKILNSYRRAFEGARKSLEEKAWIKFHSEIRDLERELDQNTKRQLCNTDRGLNDLKFKVNRSFFREHLERGELEEAALSLEEMALINKFPGVKGLKRELLRAAREMYLAGYRLEDDDLSKGVEMKDRAQEICQRLGQESCFEGMSEQKSDIKTETN